MINIKELTLKEVSEILGISEKTLFTQWKKCEPRAKDFNIHKIGKGKKAEYIQYISEDKNKVAYDILREFFINECSFDTRTDFRKLIHYFYLVLLNTTDRKCFRNSRYMEEIEISKSNLINYRKKLTDSGMMKPKRVSRGIYAYLDMNNIYNKCDVDLYDNFNTCIVAKAKELLEENYIVNLTDAKDYQKAKDIITSDDFDFEELQDKLLNILNDDLKKEALKDEIINMNMYDGNDKKNWEKDKNKNILRFYKIAFYEISKDWQEELGIKHVKFFPSHTMSDFIIRDEIFTDIIVNAYKYIQNTK